MLFLLFQRPAPMLYNMLIVLILHFSLVSFFRARRMEVQAWPATEKQDEHEYSPSREADSSEEEGD